MHSPQSLHIVFLLVVKLIRTQVDALADSKAGIVVPDGGRPDPHHGLWHSIHCQNGPRPTWMVLSQKAACKMGKGLLKIVPLIFILRCLS